MEKANMILPFSVDARQTAKLCATKQDPQPAPHSTPCAVPRGERPFPSWLASKRNPIPLPAREKRMIVA